MRILLVIAVLALSMPAVMAAETIMPTGAVTNGGTAWAQGTSCSIQGSIGQALTGAVTSATANADAGFWTCLYVETSPRGWINPGWNWIGVPSHPSFPGPATIFTLDPVNRLYVWDWVAKTVYTYADDFNTMESGTGYVALAMVGQGEDPRYSGFLPITPVDDDTAPDYRSVTLQIPAAGVIWMGHPMPWPVELSSVKVRYGTTVRTAAEDNASPTPWLNWNWTYWDSAVDTALICGLSGADDHVLRPWRHYRIWFNVPAAPNDPNGPFLIIPEP